ncbi:MAG TPA: acyl carrier protein [Caulobacteraceae bacterium]|jgi:acyl carrier protein|nr:acyl carrier protein [Caulobacteraceae bacterium]
MRQNTQLALVVGGADAGGSSTIRQEIAAIFEQVLGRPVTIHDETDIVEDLGMDSLGVMNFVMAIEDFYDISIPLDRIAQIQTVADLVRAVEQLKTGVAA